MGGERRRAPRVRGDEAFNAWIEAFEQKRAGKKALAELEKLADINSERYPSLQFHVLHACYNAARYGRDEHVERRTRDAEGLREVPKVLKAVNVLAKFVGGYPEIANAAAGFALDELQARRQEDGPSGQKGKPVPAHEEFESLLNRFAEALQGDLAGIQRGAYLHRRRGGNLGYPRGLDKQSARVDVRVTGLLFELVAVFRFWTRQEANVVVEDMFGARLRNWHEPGEAQRMPIGGRPHYALAASFASAVLGRQISSKQAKDRIEKMPNEVELWSWPDAES